ncbi:unnamed protein product, partial [Rhizoctonia solani]
SAENPIGLANVRGRSEDATGPSAASPWNVDGISVEKNSQLLFNLCDFRLISLAQIHEYVQRVIRSHKIAIGTRLGDAVSGVRLLNELFSDNSPAPWKSEGVSFAGWTDAHTSSNETQIGPSVDGAIQGEGPHIVTEVDEAVIKPRSFSTLGNDDSNPALHPLSDHVSSSEVAHLEQSPVQEMVSLTGNNFGKPPQTPVLSRSVSPVNAPSGEKQVPVVVTTGIEQNPSKAYACISRLRIYHMLIFF